MENNSLHIPVLLQEVIAYLQIKKGMLVVDCTVGPGGHAEEILKRVGESGYLIGIDRDGEVLREAEKRLSGISNRFKLFHANYRDINLVLKDAGFGKIDGALFDLGASSYQMERPDRGFSIKSDGPLDMRMDRTDAVTASNIVNGCTKQELAFIFKKFGEESFSNRIAERILKERRKKRVENTSRLASLIAEELPARYGSKRIHPATKVFMAIRIAVNREIENIEEGLNKIIPYLNTGSRICVITFHSIEDRVVKNVLKDFKKSQQIKIIAKKPIRPTYEEIINNPRSRSAKLRVAEKAYIGQ